MSESTTSEIGAKKSRNFRVLAACDHRNGCLLSYNAFRIGTRAINFLTSHGLILSTKTILRLAVVLFISCIHPCWGQTLRICSYNLLDGPINATDDQNFRVVIEAIGNLDILGTARPIDILAFQEGPESSSEYNDIEANFEAVFGSNYESTFTIPDNAGCRTGFIYNTQTVNLLGSTSLISGFTHNVRRSQFRPVGGNSDDEFFIYSIHLKAGTSSSDFSDREFEANLIRTNAAALPSDAQIIYAGDLNMKGSFEDAYEAFRAPGSNATAQDSINAPFGFQGNADWEENIALQPFHTQAPLNNMDDRFDVLFVNDRLFDGTGLELVVGSATALGNNGSHTMNSGINTGNATGGFGSELIALSDHLPVIGDFQFGQIAPMSSQSVSAEASLTRTVRTSGPVGGNSGDVFLNIEGTDHPGFESFGVVDFDLSNVQEKGTSIDKIALNMLQSNAGFSTNGPIGIYITSPAAAEVPIDSAIQYIAGENELNCVPSILSDGAEKVATYASIHRASNGILFGNGTADPIVLYGQSIRQAVLDALAGNGLIRFLIVPDEPDTAATYAGFASNLGPTRLTANLVESTPPETDSFPFNLDLIIGVQGIGNLFDLQKSDDSPVRFFSEPQSDSQAVSIQVNFSTTLPTDSPSTLKLTFESKVNSENLGQTVEIFDFDGGVWEVVDSSSSSVNDDARTVVLEGDLGRFAGPGNLSLTRVSWNANGPVFLFPWAADVDLFKWTTTE